MERNKLLRLFSMIVLLSILSAVPEISGAAEADLVWQQSGASSHSQGDSLMGIALDPTDPTYEYTVGTNTADFGSWPISNYRTGWRIEKRERLDGSVSWSYPHSVMGSAQAVTTDADNFYVAADKMVKGFVGISESHTWQIMKFNKDGSLLWTSPPSANIFSHSSFSVDPDGAPGPHAIAVDDTGIYVAGHQSSDNLLTGYSSWVVEKISLDGETLIWKRTDEPDSVRGLFPKKHLVARSLAVSGGNVYVGGYFRNYTDSDDQETNPRLQILNNETGEDKYSTDEDFPANTGIRSLTIGNGVLYVGSNKFSTSGTTSTDHWIVQKRDLSNLDLIKGIDEDYGTSSERLNSMTYANNALYLAGMTKNGSNTNWRLEKRDGDDLSMISPWPLDKNVSSGSKSDEANAIAVDGSEVYAAGYQDNKYFRAELRSDVSSCEMEAVPTSIPPKNLFENSVDSFQIQRTVLSSDILCNCGQVKINKLSGPDGVISFNPSPANFNSPIAISAGAIDSCSQDFNFQVVGDPLSDPFCARFNPIPFDIRVIKSCSVSCSPKDQTVTPGQTAQIIGSTSFPASSFSWSIPIGGGSEYVESQSAPNSNPFQITLSSGSAFKNVTVSVQNCCGSASCNVNVIRTGWVETTP